MSNLTDSGSFVNKSSSVAKEACIYSLLILPLYESKPLDSFSLNSNVCFMRSIRLLALGCSKLFREYERCLKSSLAGSPFRSKYLFSAIDGRSPSMDCASLMYLNYGRQKPNA